MLHLAFLLLLLQQLAYASPGGQSPPDTFGDGRGASCERGNASFCRLPAVPGPLPLAGAAAAFYASRKLRARIDDPEI